MPAPTSGTERYERKFRLPAESIAEIEQSIRLNPVAFREIYRPRQVNNVYYDTPNFDCYQENLDGVANRVKFRTRWYGDLYGRIEHPVFEAKIKDGLLGRKQAIPLPSLEFQSSADANRMKAAIEQEERIRAAFGGWNLSPVLLNRYTRKYAVSADGTIRMTLDSEMSFYGIGLLGGPSLRSISDRANVILELKYSPESEDRAKEVAQAFPYRLGKFSKYVEGLERLML